MALSLDNMNRICCIGAALLNLYNFTRCGYPRCTTIVLSCQGSPLHDTLLIRMRAARFVFTIAIVFLSLLGCRREYAHFLVGNLEENRDLHTLFDLLEQERAVGENRFIIIQQITNRLHGSGELEKLILFLTSYVESNQNDPYNAYYLNIVATAYRDMGAEPVRWEISVS